MDRGGFSWRFGEGGPRNTSCWKSFFLKPANGRPLWGVGPAWPAASGGPGGPREFFFRFPPQPGPFPIYSWGRGIVWQKKNRGPIQKNGAGGATGWWKTGSQAPAVPHPGMNWKKQKTFPRGGPFKIHRFFTFGRTTIFGGLLATPFIPKKGAHGLVILKNNSNPPPSGQKPKKGPGAGSTPAPPRTPAEGRGRRETGKFRAIPSGALGL